MSQPATLALSVPGYLPLLPAFFDGQTLVSNATASAPALYNLVFTNGQLFGTYSFSPDFKTFTLSDLGMEQFSDAKDANSGLNLTDLASGHAWYTSPALYPYIYDSYYSAYLYYFQGTSDPRTFYNFTTQQYVYF